MDLNRLISGLVCVACFVMANAHAGSEGIWLLVRWIVWPMALIWFGDELGSATGFSIAHPVNRESPGCAVRFAGWVFLILITGWIIFKLATGNQ